MNNNQDKIEYSDYYVAFLDILGFKNLVKSKKEEDKEKINRYFSLINEITQYLKQIQQKKDIGSIIISDSVILAVPMSNNKTENISKLRHLCIAIQKIQFNLAIEDIWLRGAISSGKAYFNATHSQIVGSAYIDAYLLEEKLAINPRVILDNKIINKLDLQSAESLINEINYGEELPKEYDIKQRNILFNWSHHGEPRKDLDKDIALFVDYLSYAFTQKKDLEIIVSNIENNIYKINHIYTKFKWVTDYLISSCKYHMSKSCEIDGNEIITQQNRLQNL